MFYFFVYYESIKRELKKKKRKKHGSWANLKGGGQLAAKAGNGAQMHGMVSRTGVSERLPSQPCDNVGTVRMDTSACRCRSDMLRSTGVR